MLDYFFVHCFNSILVLFSFQTVKKFTPKPEDSYAWQPSSVPSSAPQSPPTSAFSYTPAPSSPSHHHGNHNQVHPLTQDLHNNPSSPAHNTSSFTSSSSLPPLVDTTSSSRQRTVSQSSSSSQPPVQNGVNHHVSKSMLHLRDEPSRLPPSQSPFITLLQKNRGELSIHLSLQYLYRNVYCHQSLLPISINITHHLKFLDSFARLHDIWISQNSRLAWDTF